MRVSVCVNEQATAQKGEGVLKQAMRRCLPSESASFAEQVRRQAHKRPDKVLGVGNGWGALPFHNVSAWLSPLRCAGDMPHLMRSMVDRQKRMSGRERAKANSATFTSLCCCISTSLRRRARGVQGGCCEQRSQGERRRAGARAWAAARPAEIR